MAFFYSCILWLFHSTFTAYSIIYFSVIYPWKVRNLRFNFRHIFNGFICLIFLVEFSFWTIQFVFVYLFGSLYLFYLFGYRHSSIHPHTYWFSSLSQLFELFSYSYLSVIYSWFIRWFIRWCISDPHCVTKKKVRAPPPPPSPTHHSSPRYKIWPYCLYHTNWKRGRKELVK